MSFKRSVHDKYQIIAMSVGDALSLLGLTSADLSDKDKVKKVYRQKALDTHPDRGGSEDLMKKINQAYDVLVNAPSAPVDRAARNAEYEANKKKAQEAAKSMLATIESTLDVEKFKKHVEDATGKSFKVTTKGTVTSWHGADYSVRLASDDGLTNFDLRVHASGSDLAFGAKPLGGKGAEHISFGVSISTTVFHDNRKVKLAQRDWKFTNDHKTLIDPQELFPTAKLQKMMAKDSKDKSRKFQKRDMFLSLEKRLGARVWSGKDVTVAVPFGDLWMIILRSIWNRQPIWMTNGLYASDRGGKRLHGLPVATWAEDESTVEKLVKLQDQVKDLKGEDVAKALSGALKADK